MEIRFRNFRRTIVMGLMLLVVVIIGKQTSDEERYVAAVHMDVMESGDRSLELSLWINKSTSIRWWSDEQDDQYVFFIPGAVEGNKMKLTFPNMDCIYIDGQKVHNGEQYCFLL